MTTKNNGTDAAVTFFLACDPRRMTLYMLPYLDELVQLLGQNGVDVSFLEHLQEDDLVGLHLTFNATLRNLLFYPPGSLFSRFAGYADDVSGVLCRMLWERVKK